MAVKQDFIYSFSGVSGAPSRCHIRILEDENRPLVVVCSQMSATAGTCVTIAVETITHDIRQFLERDNVTLMSAIQNYITKSRFTKILDDLVAQLKQSKNMTIFALESLKLALEYHERFNERSGKLNGLVWVEHYAEGLGLAPYGSYAIVSFDKDSWTPYWNYLSLENLAELTGYPTSDFEVPHSTLQS
ncbi:MAG: hypothetical protein IT475_18070 [Aquimonas sp.]|nr:hypothetical protein [Aquimonas sp.]